MRFVDANVFVRYITMDDPAKAEACLKFFKRLGDGDEATTSEAVIAEVVYVLSSRKLYHFAHQDISTLLRPILALRGLKLRRKRMYLRALDLFGSHPFLDFADALI